MLDGADVALLGIPVDMASSYRVGTRFGPRAIREVSMFHGFGPEGVFDSRMSSRIWRPTK
jgi:agmatinase